MEELRGIDEITVVTDRLDYGYLTERRSGNTSRIADAAIQQLFAGMKVVVVDHDGLQQPQMNKRLYDIIVTRLRIEHPYDFTLLKEDRKKLTLVLMAPSEAEKRNEENPVHSYEAANVYDHSNQNNQLTKHKDGLKIQIKNLLYRLRKKDQNNSDEANIINRDLFYALSNYSMIDNIKDL